MAIMAQLRYASGAMAQMNLCFELPDAEFPEHTTRFQVVGEQGLLDLDMYTSVRLGQRRTWETIWEQPVIDFVNRAKLTGASGGARGHGARIYR